MPVGTLQDFFDYFRKDFEVFFKNKYKKESFRNAIYDDLVFFIRNKYIVKITFAIMDPSKDKIINGYVYEFNYESTLNVDKPPEHIQETPNSDVLLIVDFNDEWNKKEDAEKENKLLNMTMHWNFMPDIEEINTTNEDLFFQYDNYKIIRTKIDELETR